MLRTHVIRAACLAAAFGIPFAAEAQEIAHLRKDCTGISDCFTSYPALVSWIFGTRNPTASAPLLVQIGPGEFTTGSNPICTSSGHVTFRGSGRENTTLRRTTAGSGFLPKAAFWSFGCVELEFQDLTIVSPQYTVIAYNGGSTRWVDVDLVSEGVSGALASAWNEDLCASEPGLHYFFGSRIRLSAGRPNNIGYQARCDEAWFFGGDVLVTGSETLAPGSNVAAVEVRNEGSFHAFGAAIRTSSGDATTSSLNPGFPVPGLIGVNVGRGQAGNEVGGGEFHFHGGIINTTATVDGLSASGLVVAPSATKAHTPGTAFVVRAGSGGTPHRVVGAKAESPFLWQSGGFPPVASSEANVLRSEDGQDVFVETDCNSSGDCDGAGSEPHMMIYSDDFCGTSDPWFDVVTGRCRNDTGS